MQESVTCPSCLARYGLRAERISPGIRRAQCFKCRHIFNIEAEVIQILRPAQFHDEPAPFSPRVEISNIPDMDESSLMLGDIDESLLAPPVIPPPPPLPPPAPIPPPAAAKVVDHEVPRTSYSSAKDAISKLLGSTPEPPPHDRRPLSKDDNPMDLEATLDALENTLGGILPKDLSGAMPPSTPTPPPPTPPPPAPTSSAPVAETPSCLGTVKLSTEDIKAAMAAGQEEVQTPSKEQTSPILKPVKPAMPPPPPPQTEDLLRVKVGSDLYQNLTQEKLISMIEEGRVHDWNLVSRQQGERWIEAGKIPSLRPVFDNMKRNGTQPEEAPAEPTPQKRSLFGGLFGRH